MNEPITLYDIPCKSTLHKGWSPNTWKTRFSLQYKGLPFKTEWVEYPDIKPLAKKLGAKSTSFSPEGEEMYTLPMIFDPNTQTLLADSFEIARYLDTTYPNTPKLFPSNTHAFHAAISNVLWSTVERHLFCVITYASWVHLNDPSRVYCRETREKWFGKRLEEFSTEEEWAAAEGGLGNVAGWLNKNGEGNNLLFLGDKVSFADIQIASYLVWAKVCLGENSNEWARILTWHGGKWKVISEVFKQYETDN